MCCHAFWSTTTHAWVHAAPRAHRNTVVVLPFSIGTACSHTSACVLRVEPDRTQLGVGSTFVGVTTVDAVAKFFFAVDRTRRIVASGEVVPLLQVPMGVACLENQGLDRMLARTRLEYAGCLDQLDPGFSRVFELVSRLVTCVLAADVLALG